MWFSIKERRDHKTAKPILEAPNASSGIEGVLRSSWSVRNTVARLKLAQPCSPWYAGRICYSMCETDWCIGDFAVDSSGAETSIFVLRNATLGTGSEIFIWPS